MLRELNEKINKVKDDLASKEILEKKLENYKVQIEADENKLRELGISMKKEYKDVEKLEKLSLVNLISTLMKNKEVKLENEQREYLMAKVKYDEHTNKVTLFKENIENIKARLLSLRNCHIEYKELLRKKIELIKNFGDNYNKNKLEELEHEIDRDLRNKKEIEEAELAGRSLLKEVSNAEKSLNSASNWGIYDIVGGDLISSMIKHDKINEAESSFRNITSLITRFNKELGDVSCEGITMSGTTIAFDIFFDNIFTDFSVQSKINKSLNNVVTLKGKVEGIINNLMNQKKDLNRLISRKRNEYNTIIDNII
ncbi:hypothetical protein [Clostridium gasigenes]|uniref:hypothetical protein n=1 Tax=Clostridium gasigenes TaxID=94869 RepID=UPI00143862A9|nr:hypothetical protein [Clostridium gasigenes]MBB6625323.1 hypothetical protein [Clostridium gasigenes]MBU3105018.1 hypothetical protein [Clostridium gasigenes]NKF05754.1 hypothetical protein [Clostridium gasigenes]QSW19512.1 hypothetical protein J1C67_18600 [Clostridium gasigenes]